VRDVVKVLLVDGYNVLRMTPPYRELAERDLDSARVALVSDVAAFAADEWDATVVFDGAGNPHSTGEPHDAAGVHVIFSPHGQDADTVIERLAREARDRLLVTEVVTSDAQTQWAVMGGVVTRRSSAEFAGQLRANDSEWREHLEAGRRSSPVEERIAADVRDTLAKWARGQR